MYRYIRKPEKELDDIFCMTNLNKKYTGLPVVIWVDDAGSSRNVIHNTPRIKVQNTTNSRWSDDMFSVSIEKDPKVLSGDNKLSANNWKLVKKFIIDNYHILMMHWNGYIDVF